MIAGFPSVVPFHKTPFQHATKIESAKNSGHHRRRLVRLLHYGIGACILRTGLRDCAFIAASFTGVVPVTSDAKLAPEGTR